MSPEVSLSTWEREWQLSHADAVNADPTTALPATVPFNSSRHARRFVELAAHGQNAEMWYTPDCRHVSPALDVWASAGGVEL